MTPILPEIRPRRGLAGEFSDVRVEYRPHHRAREAADAFLATSREMPT
jgi:hypothetical protein